MIGLQIKFYNKYCVSYDPDTRAILRATQF